MQLLIVLAFVAASQALPLLHSAVVAPAVYGTGVSSQFRSQDNAGNYAFGYDEGHASGGTFRRESGSNGVQVGSYGLRDADGRVRTVNYVADDLGFRADIQTNEPGVEPKDPAAATINKAPLAIAAPVVSHAAPVVPVASSYVSHVAPLAVAPVSYAYAHAPAYGYVAPYAKGYSYTTHSVSSPAIYNSYVW